MGTQKPTRVGRGTERKGRCSLSGRVGNLALAVDSAGFRTDLLLYFPVRVGIHCNIQSIDRSIPYDIQRSTMARYEDSDWFFLFRDSQHLSFYTSSGMVGIGYVS